MFRRFTVVAIVLAAAACASPPNSAPQQEASKPETSHASLLAELIEKSKQVDAYTATFTMTGADGPATTSIRCDYRAPAAVKVVVTKPGGTTSAWCVGDDIVFRAKDEHDAAFSRIDLRDLAAPVAAVNAALQREFGKPAWEDGPPRSTVAMTWSFDEADQAGDFNFTAGTIHSEETSTFGWLETLRRKHAEPTVDGDLLRFTTDEGRAEIAVDLNSGFLREFVGRGQKTTLTIRLESLDLSPADKATPIELPTDVPVGDDVTLHMRMSCEADHIAALREQAYEVMSAAVDDAPWDDATQNRIEAALRPLDDWAVHNSSDVWMKQVGTWIDGTGEKFRQSEAAGIPAADLAAALSRARQSMEESFAEGKKARVARLAVAKSAVHPARAARILEIERALLARCFDEVVRAPLVATFARATTHPEK